jgi:hypothetical protein
MTSSPYISSLNTAFDAFLYASIGRDLNGLPISVLTALARQDIDPWQEAARLDRLQLESAMPRVLSLIDTLPADTGTGLDPRITAERLINLLPHLPIRRGRKTRSSPKHSQATIAMVFFYVLMMGLVFYWGH